MPWGIHVAVGSNAHGSQLLSGAIGLFSQPLPIHPVQLYEAIAALAGFFLAVWILRKGLAEGSAFLWFMAFFSMFRLISRPLTYPLPNFIAPKWLLPVIYSIVAVGCVWVALRRRAVCSNK
jgi:phosphatidylglycerol:prolipoprotein diacylglycerol transferase